MARIYGVFVIQRIDGVCLFSKLVTALPNIEVSGNTDDEKYNILSGFISAVSTIVTNVVEDYIKRMRLEGEKRVKIIIETGDKIAVAVIADKAENDRKLFSLAKSLVKQFNYLYAEILPKWNGDLSAFRVFDKIVDTEIGNTERDFTEFL